MVTKRCTSGTLTLLLDKATKIHGSHAPKGGCSLDGRRRVDRRPPLRRGSRPPTTGALRFSMAHPPVALNTSMSELVKALVASGLRVTKRTNIQAKLIMDMEDEERASLKQSLGDDCKTHHYNLQLQCDYS